MFSFLLTINVIAADPFYPALPASDPSSDLMAAFGGGAPSNNGNGASGAQASPWDLGGLDPVPLMGQVRRVILVIKTVVITKIRSSILELSPTTLCTYT